MLADVIGSVLEGDSLPAEIVVVDQSAQCSPAVAAAVPVVVLHQPGRGLSRARNSGIAQAQTDWIAILDDDMLVEATWLQRLYDSCSGASAVSGRVLRYEGEPDRHPVPDAALITGNEPRTWHAPVDRDVVPGAGLMLSKDAVIDVGGYDERMGAGSAFGAGEDNDLGLRLLRAAHVVRHEPDAVAWHRGRERRSAVLATSWAYGVGKGAFYSKHIRSANIRRRWRRDTAARLARAALRVWRDRRGAASDVVFACGVIAGSVRWCVGGYWRRPANVTAG